MLSKGPKGKVFSNQIKPLWVNTTVLYASLVSQICRVRQAGNLRSETLSSAICASQIHLTSGIWDRGLISSFCTKQFCLEGNGFRWAGWEKQHGFTDKSLSGVCQKCFVAKVWPNAICHWLIFLVTSCWLEMSTQIKAGRGPHWLDLNKWSFTFQLFWIETWSFSVLRR